MQHLIGSYSNSDDDNNNNESEEHQQNRMEIEENNHFMLMKKRKSNNNSQQTQQKLIKKRKQQVIPTTTTSIITTTNNNNNINNNIDLQFSNNYQKDCYKCYLYLPCEFTNQFKIIIEEQILKEFLQREEPYSSSFLLFEKCSIIDPFFLGYHLSLTKTFYIKRENPEKLKSLIKNNFLKGFSLSFKSISIYAGMSNNNDKESTQCNDKKEYTIYLGFDLSESCEKEILEGLIKPLLTSNNNNKEEDYLLSKKDFFFNNLHISFACRTFKEENERNNFYLQCLKQFGKNNNLITQQGNNLNSKQEMEDNNWLKPIKICSIQTTAQHLMSSDFNNQINRKIVADGRKLLLSNEITFCNKLKLKIGMKEFLFTLNDKVKEYH
ncbi:hypothetical protein ABK040_002929 [Willaertia magna]